MSHNTMTETVYELVVMRIKLDRIHDFMHHIAEGKKIAEKYAKVLAIWTATAGHMGTYYIVREWKDLKTRLEAREKLWTDADAQKHYKETSPMISCIQTFVCKAPPQFTVKALNTKAHVVIHKMKAKKFGIFAVQMHKDMVELRAKETGEEIRPWLVLFPIIHDDHCIWSFWEMGDSTTAVQDKYCKFLDMWKDPSKWHRIAEFQEHFEDEMSMLAVPFDPTKCPTLH